MSFFEDITPARPLGLRKIALISQTALSRVGMDYTLSQRKEGKDLPLPKAHLIVVSEPSSSLSCFLIEREESLAADCPPAVPL